MEKSFITGKVKLDHFRFVVFMIGFCMISIVRVAFEINLPVLVYLVYTVFLCLFSSSKEIVCFLCSLVCFSGSFQYRFALLIAIVAIILKKEIRKMHLGNAIPLLLMMLWELAHASLSGLTIYGFFQEFSELISLTVLLVYAPMDYSDGQHIRTFAYCSVFSCFMNLIACTKVLGFSLDSLTRLGKIGTDIADFQSLINPNTMSLICVMAINGLILASYKGNERRSDQIVILILIVFILLSQSKSAILCLACSYALFFLLSEHRNRFSSNKFIRNIIIVTSAMILFVTMFGDVIEQVVGRFQASDISTGRFSIFVFYSMHLISNVRNWLFGIGLFEYNSQITETYGNLWTSYLGLGTYKEGMIVYKPCHNGIQEIVVVWGVIGIVLVLFLIWKTVKHSKTKMERINYIPLLVLFIYSMQGEFLSSGSMLLCFVFSFLCLEYDRTDSGYTKDV